MVAAAVSFQSVTTSARVVAGNTPKTNNANKASRIGAATLRIELFTVLTPWRKWRAAKLYDN
jgi:hypothetical protein